MLHLLDLPFDTRAAEMPGQPHLTAWGPPGGEAGTAQSEAGRADGVAAIGLGARDTLRLEMKYALYGNDIDDTTNPLEAGLGWVVKPAKGEFIGREALEKIRAEGVRRRLVGIEMVDKAVARHGYPVHKAGRAASSPRARTARRSTGTSGSRTSSRPWRPSAPRSRWRSAARARRPRSCARPSIHPR